MGWTCQGVSQDTEYSSLPHTPFENPDNAQVCLKCELPRSAVFAVSRRASHHTKQEKGDKFETKKNMRSDDQPTRGSADLEAQVILPSQEKTAAGFIKFKSGVLKCAKLNDPDAISSMFRQFIPEDEKVYFVQYLGSKGILGIGASSFACLTDRRVADITVGFFGEVTYEDAYLETLHSSAIYQPSILSLSLITALNILIALFFVAVVIIYYEFSFFIKVVFIILIVAAWLLIHLFVVRIYYGLVKCGIRFFGTVSQLTSIYIYTNRKLLQRANVFCREFAIQRDFRIRSLEQVKR